MSERARVVARAVADEVAARDGVLAVALTGSLARGDEGAGSDVDLWVVARDDGREDFVRDGVDVTLLVTSEAYARSLECALRFEVEDAQALADPQGVLAEVKERATAGRDEVALAMRRRSGEAFAFLSETLIDAPAPLAVATLREMARRAAAFFLWHARGLRVPKWRHFEHRLFPRDLAALRAALATHEVDGDALLAAFERAAREPAPSPHWPWPPLAQVRRYLESGRREDAVLCVRQALPPVPEAPFAELATEARALFDVAHGPADASTRDAAANATRELLDRFGTEQMLPGRPTLVSASTAPSR